MSAPTLAIRPMNAADWAAFEPLWAGYLAFYRTDLPPALSRLAFDRLIDPARADMGAVVATLDSALVGFATFVLHASTWSEGPYCYLEDLYTAETARGRGVARSLIESVAAAGRDAGASKLYWQTHETNTTARLLYDRIATHDGFIVYQRRL